MLADDYSDDCGAKLDVLMVLVVVKYPDLTEVVLNLFRCLN
jgi:hypothetical protein